MKNSKVYILQILLLSILSYILIFLSNSNRRIILAIILCVFAVTTKYLLKKKRMLSIRKKDVLKLISFLAFIYIALLYTAGIYTGFYKSTIKFGINAIFNYIIPIGLIIISSEYIRNKFINYETKLSIVLNFLIQVVIDLLLFANIYKLNSVDNLILVLGYVLFASVATNLLFNYIAKQYGVKPNIIYRLITVLYIYILPIQPDIYIFFLSFYRMIYPYLTYYLIESFYGEVVDAKEQKKSKPIRIISTILLTFIIIYIGLI